jgi:hypothetical protein
MKKYLFPLLLFYSVILFGQEYNSDTLFVINKLTFKIQTRGINSDKVTLKIYRNTEITMVDTIDADGLSNLEFPDFDKDGYRDIMLTYMGNNFSYDLYLFDKTNNAFRFVEGFDRFPYPQQLKTNSKYYFSYHRAGCADNNWVSDLFLIENFRTIHLGKIYGKGCDADIEEEPQSIEIYKIIDNTEDKPVLIAKIPYLKNIPVFMGKWDFIKRYWEKNYLKVVMTKTPNH